MRASSQVEAYLEVYPGGVYVAEARQCLEQQRSLDRATRRLVQHGLAALDSSPGPADGLFGAKPGTRTRTALRQWRAAKGVAATEYLTREQADTLIALGREAGAARPDTRVARKAVARITPDQTCAGQSKGAKCWMELANQTGCYVWNPGLVLGASATWTGECSGGMAHGKGSLTWVWNENKSVATRTGLLQDGYPHGPWVAREADGSVEEGPFVDGQRQGHWIERYANGTV